MRVDLHCHTQASDGVLSPQEIIDLAAKNSLDMLAITDHDTLAGYFQAQDYLMQQGYPIRLIPGVEISTTWDMWEIHVLGLNVDPHNRPLQALLAQQKERRETRGRQIALALEKLGFKDVLVQTQKIAGNGSLTRAHFATYLVAQGVAKKQADVFRYYLAKGKPAYVPIVWPPMCEVVSMIVQASGKAVIAHPMSYQIPTRRLKKLLTVFRACQGVGLEVVRTQQTQQERDALTKWGLEFGFEASCGSDFHYPCSWCELGKNLVIPEGLLPIWHNF